MTIKKGIVPLILCAWMLSFLSPAFAGEISAWIRSESCQVYEKPAKESKAVGIIKQKAAVTVEEAGSEWMKIVYAPARDPKTGNYVDVKSLYIQKSDVTDIDPCKW